MTSVYDVVAYIRQRMPDAGPLPALKLAYWAQAWHATWEGRPLYPEHTEAWDHGPVSPEAWRAITRGFEPIAKPLDRHARDIVDAVLAFYGSLSAWDLRNLSHTEAPWIDAYGDSQPGERCDEVITVDAMRRYYTEQVATEAKTPDRPVSDEPVSVAEVLRVGRAQNEHWRETLDWLADR